MEDIERMWGKLKLTNYEGLVFVIDTDEAEEAKTSNKIVCRLLSPKPPNLQGMARAFDTIWKISKSFQMNECGDGLFIIDFESQRDKEKVMRDSP
ncbi:hypothetical protein M5689_010965 [Euphorbia peplus]|nr:hypothetical protein M5689_010965 [Euphorbia peplus]